jgi:four helix bundle protein
MKIDRFEDILAWQKGRIMVVEIYKIFSFCKDYGFKDQIQRASVSITNNIAEGFERRTNKEFLNFLFIAKGSCGEVRSMLNLALELKYINKEQFVLLYNLSHEVSKIISGFIKCL